MTLQFGNLIGPTRKPGDAINAPIVFFDDFLEVYHNATAGAKFSEVTDAGAWHVTLEAGGTVPVAVDNADGGFVAMATDNVGGERISCQLNGEAFLLEEGRELIFETRLKVSAIATGDLFVGLSLITTDPAATSPSDFIAFEKHVDADIECRADTGSGGTAVTDTGEDFVADTFVTLNFEYDGKDTVRFHVNGAEVHKTTTTVPKGIYMSPVMCIEATTTTAETLTVDYVFVANQRAVDQGN